MVCEARRCKLPGFLFHPENVAQKINGPTVQGIERRNNDGQKEGHDEKVFHGLRFGGENGNDVRTCENRQEISPHKIISIMHPKVKIMPYKGNKDASGQPVA